MHNNFLTQLRILPNNKWEIEAENEKMNFRKFEDGSVGISLDESTTEKDILKFVKFLIRVIHLKKMFIIWQKN